MKTKPLAFSVHLFTASGAALALMALVAATQGNWRLMFGWLGIALIVDGIDGPLARRVDIKKNASNWDGVVLDLVIDYLTYVFIPAYALIYTDLLPSPWGLIAALLIALTGVVYFADVRMKSPDNCFVGFPAVWQMPLLVFLTFSPPVWVTSATIVVLALAQFTWAEVRASRAHRALADGDAAGHAALGGAGRLVGLGGIRAADGGQARASRHQPVAALRRHRDAGAAGAPAGAGGVKSGVFRSIGPCGFGDDQAVGKAGKTQPG